MADLAALLAEQDRLRPMLDRLLGLAALWADRAAPEDRRAADVARVADDAAPVALARGGPSASQGAGRPVHTGAGARHGTSGMIMPHNDLAPSADLPREISPAAHTVAAPSGLEHSPPPLPRGTEPATFDSRRDAAPLAAATFPAMNNAVPVARLPALRGRSAGRMPPAPAPAAAAAPFAAVAAMAAPPDVQPSRPSSVADSGVRREGVPIRPAAPQPGSPLRMGMAAAPAVAPFAGWAGQGSGAGLAAMAATGRTFGQNTVVPADPAMLPGDTLEEQLADLLERAAAEAGVALP